jgi:hypothetical protein
VAALAGRALILPGIGAPMAEKTKIPMAAQEMLFFKIRS